MSVRVSLIYMYSAADAAQAVDESLPDFIHPLIHHKLWKGVAEYLGCIEAAKLISHRITILLDDIIVQLVEVLHEFFSRCQLVVGKQGIYIVKNVCCIALKPL